MLRKIKVTGTLSVSVENTVEGHAMLKFYILDSTTGDVVVEFDERQFDHTITDLVEGTFDGVITFDKCYGEEGDRD